MCGVRSVNAFVHLVERVFILGHCIMFGVCAYTLRQWTLFLIQLSHSHSLTHSLILSLSFSLSIYISDLPYVRVRNMKAHIIFSKLN